VASATALPLIKGDHAFVDVTGTTTVTSIASVGVGERTILQFDGALTLTHHATDLVLPNGANITTASGDYAEFLEYASGDWVCINYQRASGAPAVAIKPESDVEFGETVLSPLTGATTMDTNTDLEWYGTITGPITLTVSNMSNGKSAALYLKTNDTDTVTASGFTWWSGTAPVLSTTKWTRIQFEQRQSTIYAFASLQG